MREVLLNKVQSAQDTPEHMSSVAKEIISASAEDYEDVIQSLIQAGNEEALLACMQHFSRAERAGIRSPFEILVCSIDPTKGITPEYTSLLSNVVAYLEEHRPDLFTDCIKGHMLEEMWWAAADWECLDHFEVVISGHTFPQPMLKHLYKVLRSYDNLDKHYRGELKPIQKIKDCSKNYLKFFFKTNDLLMNLVSTVGSYVSLEWFMERKAYQRYLVVGDGFDLIASNLYKVITSKVDITEFDKEKGHIPNEQHHLIMMVRYGVAVSKILNGIDRHVKLMVSLGTPLTEEELQYVHQLKSCLRSLESEPEPSCMSSYSILSVANHALSAVPALLPNWLATALTYAPGFRGLDPVVEEVSHVKVN